MTNSYMTQTGTIRVDGIGYNMYLAPSDIIEVVD